MKISHIYKCFLLSFVFIFSQCEKGIQHNSVSSSVTGEKIQISFTSKSNTKCLISEYNEGEDLMFTWESGDKVSVYDGQQFCGDLALDPSCVGKEEGIFKGEISAPTGSSLKFFYFGKSLSAPKESELVLDFNDSQNPQTGLLPWCQNNVVALCELPIGNGSEYSGDFKLAFSIYRFSISEGFSAGDKIAISGLKQVLKVSKGGVISYEGPESDTCVELVPSSSSFYIATPSDTDAKNLAVINLTQDKYKVFDKDVENGIFYKADVGLTEHTWVVRYWVNDGTGVRFPESASEFSGESLYHGIIYQEPYWTQSGDKTFLGWSENKDDTAARYISKLRFEESSPAKTKLLMVGKEVASGADAGKVVKNLYAIWKDVTMDGPWVDYEHYSFSEPLRFDHLDGWELNRYIQFQGVTNHGFEKLNIPVRNLTVGKWYAITFSEKMLKNNQMKWWNADSNYACAVKANPTYDHTAPSSMLPCSVSAPAVEPFVWIHSDGVYDTNDAWSESYDETRYQPVNDAKIIFKATQKTMYWIWDLSKQKDGAEITYRFSNNPLIEVIDVPDPSQPELVTSPTIDFVHTSFNSHFEFGNCASMGWSTCKLYAETDNFIEFHTYTNLSHPKVNVPIMGLMSGKTYSLSFTLIRTPYDDIAPGSGTDYRGVDLWKSELYTYGFQASENMDTSKSYSTADGFSTLPTDRTSTITTSFTASESVMYMVLNMSGIGTTKFSFVIKDVSISEK